MQILDTNSPCYGSHSFEDSFWQCDPSICKGNNLLLVSSLQLAVDACSQALFYFSCHWNLPPRLHHSLAAGAFSHQSSSLLQPHFLPLPLPLNLDQNSKEFESKKGETPLNPKNSTVLHQLKHFTAS